MSRRLEALAEGTLTELLPQAGRETLGQTGSGAVDADCMRLKIGADRSCALDLHERNLRLHHFGVSQMQYQRKLRHQAARFRQVRFHGRRQQPAPDFLLQLPAPSKSLLRSEEN